MSVRCELSIAESVPSAQPAELSFALTNASADPIQILVWQTPFEGIKAPMFDISRDGAAVEYRGRMLKRGSPRKEEYLVLKPGERRAAKIHLADGWDVDAPGRYTIEYSAQLFDVASAQTSTPRSVDEFNAVPLSCNSVTFTRSR